MLVLLPFPKGSKAICGKSLRVSGDTIYVMHIFVWAQWLFGVPATALAVLYIDLTAVWVLSLLLWEEQVKFPASPAHQGRLERWRNSGLILLARASWEITQTSCEPV
ncbi:hypothetical protein Q669_29140 [Labrenzia sp. C1B10]|nr:hypothetical protein Q669_29140 [Labrenzia sp. C1B10]